MPEPPQTNLLDQLGTFDSESFAEDAEDQETPIEESASEPEPEPESETESVQDDEQIHSPEWKQEKESLLTEIYRLRQRNRDSSAREQRLELLEGKLAELLSEDDTRQIPDRDEDPVGYLEAKNDAVIQELKALREDNQRGQQVQAAQSDMQTIAAMEQQFMTEHPDYPDAVQKLRDGMEWQLMNVNGLTKEEAVQQINAYEIQFARSIKSRGGNPAEAVYQAAQKMAGFTPGKVQATQQKTEHRQPKAPPKTLSRSAGSQGSKTITADVVNEMSRRELANFMFANDGANWEEFLETGSTNMDW